MNFSLNFTKKTYFAVGMIAAALNLAGGVAYMVSIQATALFTIASIATGGMLLLLGAEEGFKTLEGKCVFVALLAQLLYFFPGVLMKVCGAVIWPIFAFPYWKQSAKDDGTHTMAFLTMLAGGVQLLFSFVPLPGMFKAVLAVVISAIQLALAWMLYQDEKHRLAEE